MCNSALEIVRKELGVKHYKLGLYLNSRGLSQAMRQDFQQAYDDLKEAVKILIHNLGPEHLEVADCYASLGDICMKLQVERNGPKDVGPADRLAEARKFYTDACNITEKALGLAHTKCQQYQSLLFICDHYAELS